MQKDYEQTYHNLEDEHFWFVGRRDCLTRLVDVIDPPKTAAILDIGCASGQMLRALQSRGYDDLTGIDISDDAIQRCQEQGMTKTHVMDGGSPDFPDASFDLILASDVLEHIEDDVQSLKNWARLLKPGGQLVVFVPAFESLWTEHDEINRHYRRYRRGQLDQRVRDAGMSVLRSGYWNAAMFPAVAGVRLLRRVYKKTPLRAWMNGGDTELMSSDITKVSPLNPVLKGILNVENRIMARGFNPPFGVSTYAIARREG